MNIILQGYMGSGKSTVAVKLASTLHLQHIDLDQLIESHENLSVTEIFSLKGEIYFRKLESHLLNSVLSQQTNFVLALGGGTPCYGNNLDAIKTGGVSIYLKGSIALLCERIANSDNRPLIQDRSRDDLTEFIAKHLFERSSFYEQSDFVVTIDGKTADEIVNEIVALLT
ncbi:MAG: shikimate kinase [Flavobacterium sp.]|nr:shikimate kinase [Flavobacterium sp.]